MFLFHRYTDRAGYLQRTSCLQLEGAASVLVLWAYCAYFLASRAGALCGGKVGCSRNGWTDGGGLVEREPGRVGWGLPFYRVELSLRNLQNRVISACRSQT